MHAAVSILASRRRIIDEVLEGACFTQLGKGRVKHAINADVYFTAQIEHERILVTGVVIREKSTGDWKALNTDPFIREVGLDQIDFRRTECAIKYDNLVDYKIDISLSLYYNATRVSIIFYQRRVHDNVSALVYIAAAAQVKVIIAPVVVCKRGVDRFRHAVCHNEARKRWHRAARGLACPVVPTVYCHVVVALNVKLSSIDGREGPRALLITL